MANLIASKECPATTAITIARPALAAMCEPMIGIALTRDSPEALVSENFVSPGSSSRTSTFQSATMSLWLEMVVTGTSLNSTMRCPYSVSKQTTACFDLFSVKSSAFAFR